jgi:membrane protease YdiL (CAAX protease family)
VLAALGCGLVWGLIVARTGRLPVAIFSHALFTWCVAVQFPLWRLV